MNMHHFLRNYLLSFLLHKYFANSGGEEAIWQTYLLHATQTQKSGKMAKGCDSTDKLFTNGSADNKKIEQFLKNAF